MSAALLFEIGWKSAFVAGAALALPHLLRHGSAAQRSAIAHAGLLAVLVLPVIIVAGPNWVVEPPAPFAGAIDQAQASSAADPAAPGPARILDPPGAVASLGAGLGERGAWLARNLHWVAYAIPALVLLFLAVLSVMRLHMLRLRSSVLVDENWLTALAQAQRRMGFKHGTALLISSEVASPVSWGVFRPVILLSENAAHARSNAEAIIAHELAHLTHLDWAKLLIGRAATAILWFNPLIWLLVRQCHQLREEAADDAVLESGVSGEDYAALLVSAARHESGAWLLAANGVAPGAGSLQRRVARALDAKARRTPTLATWSVGCGLAALLIAGPLAATTFAPSTTIGAASSLEFTALELRGRGKVTFFHGSAPRVRLVAGSGERTEIAVRDGRLVIDACTSSCPGYQPEIEIVAPRLRRVAVEGGGAVQSKGSFPDQPSLDATINGGGVIRMSGIEAERVTATIIGGGTIKARVGHALEAVIRGDGSIVYWGKPSLSSSVVGGGVIVRADDD